MAITQTDLLNLENKIKLDISKEQQELRHSDRKILQTYYYKVDSLEKNEAVNDNILKTMNTSIGKLENIVTEWFEKINTKIGGLQWAFATKEDHKENVSKIWAVEKALENINLRIAGVSGWFAVIIFLIDKYAK